MVYVTKDANKDRDDIKRKKKLTPPTDTEAEKLVFRNMFIDERDAEIARVVWNYFDAVASRWPTAWDSSDQGDVLNRTNGFSALMRFLGPVYRELSDDKDRLSYDKTLSLFRKIKLRDSDFTRDNYPPGTTGETKLFKDLREKSGLE
jgi:hypothetical protein